MLSHKSQGPGHVPMGINGPFDSQLQSELIGPWTLRFSGASPVLGYLLPQPIPKLETKSNGLLSHVAMVGDL